MKNKIANKKEAIFFYKNQNKFGKLEAKQAFNILLSTVDESSSDDCFRLGDSFDNGIGTKKSFKKAFFWYLKAAKLGDKVAQYNIYLMYRDGDGVKKDIKKAIFWLKKSAKNNDLAALSDLGYKYFYGYGVKQNEKTAAKYYKKAADKNFPRALYNLGLCYLDGTGVKQSDDKAIKLLKKALSLKHFSAAEILADIYSGDYEPEIKKNSKLQKKYMDIYKKFKNDI